MCNRLHRIRNKIAVEIGSAEEIAGELNSRSTQFESYAAEFA